MHQHRYLLLLILLAALLLLTACPAPVPDAEPPDDQAEEQVLTESEPATEAAPVADVSPPVLERTSGAIIIDHTTTDLACILPEWLAAAKQNVVWLYGHTSHGSQLVTGANYLSERVEPPAYNFLTEWGAVPAQSDPPALRLADDDGWSWDPGELYNKARGYLDDPAIGPRVTAFMWSWCGEMSDAGTPVDEHLDIMERLVQSTRECTSCT